MQIKTTKRLYLTLTRCLSSTRQTPECVREDVEKLETPCMVADWGMPVNVGGGLWAGVDLSVCDCVDSSVLCGYGYGEQGRSDWRSVGGGCTCFDLSQP